MSTAPVVFHPILLKEPVRPEDAGRIGVEDLILNNFNDKRSEEGSDHL